MVCALHLCLKSDSLEVEAETGILAEVIDWRSALKRKLQRNESVGWAREKTKKICGFSWAFTQPQEEL